MEIFFVLLAVLIYTIGMLAAMYQTYSLFWKVRNRQIKIENMLYHLTSSQEEENEIWYPLCPSFYYDVYDDEEEEEQDREE